MPYVGEIRMVGFSWAPEGWFPCDGSLLSIQDYMALYSLIGTTYGGDGVNNFALPDFRCRMPIHQGNGFLPGQAGGEETVTLVPDNLPVHTHQAIGQNGEATQTGPTNGFWATAAEEIYSDRAPTALMNTAAIGSAGNSQAHENMMPYLVINFIIAPHGEFPPHS